MSKKTREEHIMIPVQQ